MTTMAAMLAILWLSLPFPVTGMYAALTDSGGAGMLGVACAEEFESVPGNAQYLCPSGLPDRTAVLFQHNFPDSWPALVGERHVLAHEAYHLYHGVQAGPDPFDEAGAYEFACSKQFVYECFAWRAQYGW